MVGLPPPRRCPLPGWSAPSLIRSVMDDTKSSDPAAAPGPEPAALGGGQMIVRRGFLYTGVFLIAAGGIVLLAQVGAIDTEAVIRALSLWPLAVIAIGVGLILRRTRARVPGGVVAAAAPGLMLGMMIVAVPDMPDFEVWSGWSGWSTPCGEASREATVTERQGTFGAAASVDL